MEYKVGEIFEYNGGWYQAVERTEKSCKACYFYSDEGCFVSTGLGWCRYYSRNDNKSVIFKKLEKVGETYEKRVSDGTFSTFQRYKVYNSSVILPQKPYIYYNFINSTIEIEIKQKEDMEEKKVPLKKDDIDFLCSKFNQIVKYCVIHGYDEDSIQHEFEKLFLVAEESDIKSNLKPFSLEAAKAGKSVCTRDGRKVRIICFDDKGTFPIIALVDEKGEEFAFSYTVSGKYSEEIAISNKDLMMLPEKKEGWVNVYRDCDGANITKDDNIYSSKEAAMVSAQVIDRDNYVATTIIEWEEWL